MTDHGPSDPGAHLVVGTAGHIDHGKTSMVRTLTGVDLDSLPEEVERGITIALGFTALELPDGRRAAFVDVPGHEGLVRTMVAGATGVDAVLLCVSAVDGVMPQTREHLAILELLDVRAGGVVLTMADLVDDDLLELAAEDVADAVAGTFLEGTPVVPFSAVTAQGRDAVVALLATLEPRQRARTGPFRLPVDRSFVRPGFGTVVTGTTWSGVLEDGSQVALLPGGDRARVRGIQTHGRSSKTAEPGWRVALNLAGIERAQVPRGTVVCAGEVAVSHMVDVRYHHLPSAPDLEDGAAVRFLLGTAECMGRLHVADDLEWIAPGRSTWAQVRLEAPVAAMPGDRFVIRRSSPVVTLGGGVVVDPWAPRLRRKDRTKCREQLARLHRGELVVWLERAGEEGLDPAAWRHRAPGSTAAIALADRQFAPTVVGRLEGALLSALASFHADQPLSLGAQRRELRRGRLAHLPERVFDALVDRLATAGAVTVQGPILRAAGHEVELTRTQAALQARVLATLSAAGLDGVSIKAVHKAHPEPEVLALVRLLEAARTVELVPKLGLVPTAALDELREAIRTWFTSHEELSPGDFKTLTGLSRKAAIPLLEWLDRARLTRRTGGVRVAGPGLQ